MKERGLLHRWPYFGLSCYILLLISTYLVQTIPKYGVCIEFSLLSPISGFYILSDDRKFRGDLSGPCLAPKDSLELWLPGDVRSFPVGALWPELWPFSQGRSDLANMCPFNYELTPLDL